jgi:hypothetical protein
MIPAVAANESWKPVPEPPPDDEHERGQGERVHQLGLPVQEQVVSNREAHDRGTSTEA